MTQPIQPIAGLPPRSVAYAVVGDPDHTQVSDLVALSPGPRSWRRTHGLWLEDPSIVASLRSMQPPPLVELTPDQLVAVTDQVDASDAANAPNATTAGAGR